MDAGFGDHNPYSKFNYGGLQHLDLSQLTIHGYIRLKMPLKTMAILSLLQITGMKHQDAIKNTGLSCTTQRLEINSHSTYAFDEGLVVYHVNAQLIDYTYAGERAIDVYTTNNQDSYYNTGVNLIELVNVSGSGYTLGVGQTSNSNIVDDYGNKIGYTFKLNSMDGSKANITFTANK